MKKLVILVLAGAFLLGTASMIFAGTPVGGMMNTPATNANMPAGSTRGTWDDFFRSPATPQDMALAQAIIFRMQQWKDPALAQASTPNAGTALPCVLCGVTVEARNGYIRLNGKVASLQQSMTAENIARSTQGVATVINAITVGR
jgi:hypothetical protein